MKKLFSGLVAGLVLGTAGTAVAATAGFIWSGQTACRKESGRAGGFSCVDSDSSWAVGINDRAIVVMRPNGTTAWQRIIP